MSPKSKFLQELPQYHFDRDDFVSVFYEIFDDYFRGEDVIEACISGKGTSSFVLYYCDDEFYILHMPSGTIINWYKHLGRTNTCNKDGFTLDDLREFFQLLDEEL